jgi:hypothetical protein
MVLHLRTTLPTRAAAFASILGISSPREVDFIPNAPAVRSTPPSHRAHPHYPPRRALLPSKRATSPTARNAALFLFIRFPASPPPAPLRRPLYFYLIFSLFRSRLPSVATSRRRCAPLNHVRVPVVVRDVTTAPAFYSIFRLPAA